VRRFGNKNKYEYRDKFAVCGCKIVQDLTNMWTILRIKGNEL